MVDITPNSYIPPSSAEVPGGIIDVSSDITIPTPSGTMIQPTKSNSLGGLQAGATEVSQGSGNNIFKISPLGIHLGAANFADAPFKVNMAGAITASDITITGGTISSDVSVALGALNIAAQGWTQTSAFTVTDADTVAWGAGTLTTAAGTAYSIGAANTGNMVAKTYIYLDIAISTTAYQTTTTAATSVGAGKILVATAENDTGEATFTVLAGQGATNIAAGSIVANSITANELSTSITYAGSIIIDTAGLIRSGQTAYDTGTGWWIGNDAGTPKFSIGNSAANKITWNGSTLTITGTVPDTQVFTVDGTWTKPAGALFVRVKVIGAGGGGGGGQSFYNGGSGGGGGAILERIFRASDLPATVAIAVGAGGAAGAAQSNGGAGGISSFGAYAFAYGGGGGWGANSTSGKAGGGGGGVGGGGALGGGSTSLGGLPASTTGTNGISGQGAGGVTSDGKNGEYGGGAGGGNGLGGSSLFGGAGGGGGGGTPAGAGGAVGSYVAGGGGAGGVGAGANGIAGTDGDTTKCGTGGGGGANIGASGIAGVGGAGGAVGGGGGGGGGALAGGTMSAGGAGGRGQVMVYTS